MLNAIWQSVFTPRSFLKNNPRAELIISRYGWIFIALRWFFYSIFFAACRNYKGNWKPFAPPPFGLDLNTYACWQKYFSLVFGFFLMSAIAIGVWAYLKICQKHVSFFKILNILGLTFFLPFLFLQPLDQMVIFTSGWVMSIIIPLHTAVLIWEAITAIVIIDGITKLKRLEKVSGIILIIFSWILICGIFWR